ncbi:MAG: ABC transporter permease [Defluviitaleaceae bacterium]|nr:ABC transporter permease [Defluviitaleaceae bacterium]
MNFIQRARASVIRNPGKGAILLGLILLLASLIAGAIIIRQAINHTILQAQRSVLPIVTTSRDLELLWLFDEQPVLELITEDIVEKIGELPYVNHFDYSLLVDPLTRLDVYVPELKNGDTDGIDGNLDGEYNFFWLSGVSHPEVIHIEEGLFELIEGRVFTAAEMNPPSDRSVPTPILMPRVIAQLNGLSIGSVFNLYYEHFMLPEDAVVPEGGFFIDSSEVWDHPYSNWESVSYEFEIIGLLDLDYHLAINEENFHMQFVVFNTVFAPNWKLDEMIREQFEARIEWQNIFNLEGGRTLEEMLTPTVFWVLEDSLYLEDFIVEAEPLLPDFYKIDAWTQVFTPLHGAMENMQSLADQILWFGVGAILIVLSLLILLYFRDRRHEMGIYLALGEKKIKIIFQLLAEVMTVSLVSLTVAIFIGNIVSSHVSQGMLRQGLIQESIWTTGSTSVGEWQQFSSLEFRGMGREVTLDELIEIFEVSLERETIVIFYAVGLVTIILSTLFPISYVLKLNAKEILMQGKIG